MHSLYKPLNEEEVMKARFNILPNNVYDAYVTSAIRTKSGADNVMADIMVKIVDNEGNTHEIRDFLVFTQKMLWKIKHFCDSAGLQQKYEEGNFQPEDAKDKHIRVLVGTKIGDVIPFDRLGDRPEGSRYRDKNIIIDYVAREPITVVNAANQNHFDDAIPF